jgi:hypothetical protein
MPSHGEADVVRDTVTLYWITGIAVTLGLGDRRRLWRLSDLVIGTIQRMVVLARDGVSPERLNALAQRAMTAWPQRVKKAFRKS